MSLTVSAAVRRGGFELDLDLDVPPGEVLGVLGPNGSGKSTLLRAVAGLTPVQRGEVRLDGTVLDRAADQRFVPPEQRPIGVVFQDDLLFEHLDALDNIAFGLRAGGMRRRPARVAAQRWLDRVGLGELAHRRPGELSGGQRQRVALARALAVEPRVLLLDEPLAALDVATRRDIRRELRRQLAAFDGIRLLVTHDPLDAYALADRIAIIEDGRLVQLGAIEEIAAHPRSRYVAELVGTNLIEGTIRDSVMFTPSGAELAVVSDLTGPALAVIRPQSVTISRQEAASSARNVFHGVVHEVERYDGRARLSIDGPLPLVAEITLGALDAMGLRPGDAVHASVKATDITTFGW
jgi:molybdate transport system ATP-binding protein